MADEPKTFKPGTAETNRARQQGLGMGARELDAQRDPQLANDGIENEIDDEVERLSPDDDGPPTGALHGENHTRRPIKTEADRGQGPKTRAANREKVKGSRRHNPR